MNNLLAPILAFGVVGIVVKIILAILVYIALKFMAKHSEKYTKFVCEKILKLKNEDFEKAILVSFTKPVSYLLNCLGIYFAIQVLPLPVGVRTVVLPWVSIFLRLSIIIIVSIALQNLVENHNVFLGKLSKKFEDKSKTLIHFATNITKAIIVALTVVIALSEIGYDITGLIAGLGLTGLTFALAAQDTASNFFSGIIILLDKPFGVGDWISIGGMEGIIEEINLRSCRIRTFDNALITVPNNKLSNDSVTNWSKMNLRKTNIIIGLLYSTPKEKLQKISSDITERLSKLEEIKSDSILVRFDNFNASSLDIAVTYNSYPLALADHVKLKEKAQYEIMDIVYANKADFAYNTLTIHNA